MHLALLLLALLLTACKDDTGVDPRIRDFSLTLAPDSLSLPLGDSVALDVTIRNRRGELSRATVAWMVLDPSIAIMSPDGLLTARGEGFTLVIGRVGSSVDTVRLHVYAFAPVITGISPEVVQFGSQSATLTVSGTGFRPGSVVRFNGRDLVTSYVDEARLTASATAEDLARFHTAQITVRTPGQYGQLSKPLALYVGNLPARSDKRIAAGEGTTCALTIDDDAYCWGKGDGGRLGNGTRYGSTFMPVMVSGAQKFERISVGASSACALNRAGNAYCWGSNSYGQLGALGNPTGVPVAVSGSYAFHDIAVGDAHVCAITSEGDAYCWGRATDELPHATPARVQTTQKFVGITAGARHTCALTSEARVYCWPLSGSPALVQFAPPISRIAAAANYTCALNPTGEAYCWGDWRHDGSPTDFPQPVTPGLSYGLTDLSAGAQHVCALRYSEVAVCWGRNTHGQIGDMISPISPDFLSPRQVANLQRARYIAAGATHSCAIGYDRSVYCWGERGYGQLASKPGVYSLTLLPVETPSPMRALSVGNERACGIDGPGSVYCWGAHTQGQMERVASLPPAETISVGDTHACALTSTGVAYCWWNNTDGQLGDGTQTSRSAAVAVSTTLRFRAIAAGSSHTCALGTDNAAYCWGSNVEGRLGDGTAAGSTTPRAVIGGLTFESLAVGDAFTCAVTADNNAYCWGSDYAAQLGANGIDSCLVQATRNTTEIVRCSTRPIAVANGLPIHSISAGSWHACARTTAGLVYCWGASQFGQLANAAPPACRGLFGMPVYCSAEPLLVGGLTFTEINVGKWHSCGIAASGQLYCWGAISQDFFLIPDFGEGATPVSGATLVTIESGGPNTCGLTVNGEVYCLGMNDKGQFGKNYLPVQLGAVRINGELRF